MNLEGAIRFKVARSLVAQTDDALRAIGRQGYEGIAVWTGVLNAASEFIVEEVVVPRQQALRTADGLCVTVDGDELHRINVMLYLSGRSIGCQIHTHPTTAYHSDTDDAFAIAAQLGSLSLVVPYFCRHGLLGEGVATYRLAKNGWRRADPSLRLWEAV